jgi:superfamily I DNA/RNA helicase
MQENRRVFFKGSAGTGKTFLAIESARRCANLGKKLLLLCYNKGLCDWIRKEVGQEPSIHVYNIDSFLIKLCDDPNLLESSKDLDSNFWNITLPNKALESNGLRTNINKYDQVILDEAQDLLKPTYLEVIDQVLKEGLRSGNWVIFGDFINQSIFSSYSNNKYFITLEQFEEYLNHSFAKYTLTKNCRNIQQVGDYYESIVKLNPGYNSYLRNNIYGSIGAEVIHTPSLTDKLNVTLQIIKKSISDIEKLNIAILSIYDDEYLAKTEDNLMSLDIDINTDIVKYLNKGGIYLGTVQSFKGLEADTVVLRSSNGFLEPEDLNLFYVGCSRARDNLYVLK